MLLLPLFHTYIGHNVQLVPFRGSHRKALIIDDTMCLMGSRNLHKLYFEPLEVRRRRRRRRERERMDHVS